jgi:hypothetical protein
VRLNGRTSLLLLAFAIWSWIIWPTFLKNVWSDPRSFAPGPTSFFVVHAVLTGLSLVFGTAIGVLGWRGYAAARREGSRG